MPSKNAVRESLSGCIIPVLPFRPATAGSPSGIAVLECVDHVVWLVLRGRSASAVVGTGCGPFLLPLQLLIVFGLLARSPSGRSKRIIRFAHPQTPGYLQRVKTRPSPAIFCCGRTPPFSIRGLPQLSRRSARSVTFALEPFAHRLTVSTDRLGPLAHSSLRWFFVGATPLHLAKGALTLHLFLQDADCGIDVVVADIDQRRIVTLS